jgi:hypothetical protein
VTLGFFGWLDSQWLTALRWTWTASASCICDRPAWRLASRMRDCDGMAPPQGQVVVQATVESVTCHSD